MTQSDKPKYPSRILIVDDEKSTRLVIGRALQLSGYLIDTAENGKQALERLETTCYDVMLLDLKMPEVSGIQVMDVVRERYPELKMIVLTAHASLDSAITAVKTGAVDYLLKPQSITQIDAAIQRVLKKGVNQAQRQHLIDIMAEAMETLQAQNSAAPLDVTKQNRLGAPIELNGMLFDPEQRTVISYRESSTPHQPVVRTTELTAHQTAILSYMVLHPNKVLSSLEISREALEYHNLSEIEAVQIVRPHILKLRRKIETDPSYPRLIRSVRGKGYLFCPP
ncbi:MAG: response regulator transcription factor [Anaerolineae bacterium]|jgi:two-component system KDP operon response regulator KdpE|nr:response regulator transcription factor [Anaerolineae bacterium]